MSMEIFMLLLIAVTGCLSFNHILMNSRPRIALTREKEANEPLVKPLSKEYTCVTLPCIKFQTILSTQHLASELKNNELLLLTSPHAATVFIDGWKKLKYRIPPKIASIGKGTTKVLTKEGILPCFESHGASASSLAAELPLTFGTKVLHLTSNLANDAFSHALNERGFTTTRINGYETVPEDWTNEELDLAKSVEIVCFASPSAVNVWALRAGTGAVVVAIGATTAKAATKAGFDHVFYPIKTNNNSSDIRKHNTDDNNNENDAAALDSWIAKIKEVAADYSKIIGPK